jgi:hypothetical protein
MPSASNPRLTRFVAWVYSDFDQIELRVPMKNRRIGAVICAALVLVVTLAVALVHAADKPADGKWERVGDRLRRPVVGEVSKRADRDDSGLGYQFPIDGAYTLGCGWNEKSDRTFVSLVRADAKGESLFGYEHERGYRRITLGSCIHYDLDGNGTIDAWVKDADTPYVRIDGKDVEVRKSKTNFRKAVDAEYTERLNDEGGTTIVFRKGKWI